MQQDSIAFKLAITNDELELALLLLGKAKWPLFEWFSKTAAAAEFWGPRTYALAKLDAKNMNIAISWESMSRLWIRNWIGYQHLENRFYDRTSATQNIIK